MNMHTSLTLLFSNFSFFSLFLSFFLSLSSNSSAYRHTLKISFRFLYFSVSFFFTSFFSLYLFVSELTPHTHTQTHARPHTVSQPSPLTHLFFTCLILPELHNILLLISIRTCFLSINVIHLLDKTQKNA